MRLLHCLAVHDVLDVARSDKSVRGLSVAWCTSQDVRQSTAGEYKDLVTDPRMIGYHSNSV